MTLSTQAFYKALTLQHILQLLLSATASLSSVPFVSIVISVRAVVETAIGV